MDELQESLVIKVLIIQNFDKLWNERAINFENYLSITYGFWNTIHVFKE